MGGMSKTRSFAVAATVGVSMIFAAQAASAKEYRIAVSQFLHRERVARRNDQLHAGLRREDPEGQGHPDGQQFRHRRTKADRSDLAT